MSKPTITQADMDAAAFVLDALGGIKRFEPLGISFAQFNRLLTETLTRHREAATPEGIRLGLEAAAKAADVRAERAREICHDDLQQANTAAQIADRIRALDPATILREANNAD